MSFASLRPGLLVLLFVITSFAQTVPAPKDVLGWTPGDDRKLASWAQIVDYFKALDKASDRVQFQEIGKTTMGAPFVYATITSAANMRNLEKYKAINAKLADPRTFASNDKTAQTLIAQGKTIIAITCSIHSDEVGGALSSMLMAYRLASANDAETKNILDNTIILLVPSQNPDGVDIIKNWYDKTLGTPYEGTEPPELYHKYTGHDNNRDWYAFTQVETQLTVDKILNVWRPQIVHDIHQQGANGSRLFLPPYMQPVEPNVPKQIVEGYTELGNFIAKDLRSKGFQGITTDSTYDAWTPSRAYSHYHGAVRILSETASCKLATPVNIKYEQLRNGLGYDVHKEAPNFGPVWLGGEWHLRDITNYMTTAAFSLMTHAANNRKGWLTRFYAIGKEAVRPKKKGEIYGYLVSPSSDFEKILERAKVEFKTAYKENKDGSLSDFLLIKTGQPYIAFAKALLEKQHYPDLKDDRGNPIPPYDVTAHTISLLYDLDVEPIYSPLPRLNVSSSGPDQGGCPGDPKINYVRVYRSYIPSIDEGWTSFVLEKRGFWRHYGKPCETLEFSSLDNAGVKKINEISRQPNNLAPIIFPDQAPDQMLNGYPKGSMPEEYTGGIGKEGVKKLKDFVEDGGTLVFLNKASKFAIEQFDLPIKDVTDGLQRKDFYIPGSILRTEINTAHPLAKGMPAESIAWSEDSPAFEVKDAKNVEIIASYPTDPSKILLSGWALGAEKIAGKAALVEVHIGKGKIILFGFRPQYRGQSLATFPLFFNAITN
jgi:hypothetical protein